MAGARKVRLQLRFGSVDLANRSVRAKRGAFRAVFGVRRLRAGRLEVVAKARGRTLRATVMKRTSGSPR
jgi:hypothetical protein